MQLLKDLRIKRCLNALPRPEIFANIAISGKRCQLQITFIQSSQILNPEIAFSFHIAVWHEPCKWPVSAFYKISFCFSFLPPKLKNILLLDFVAATTTMTSDDAGVVVDKTSFSKLSSMATLLEELDADVALEVLSSFNMMPLSLLDSCCRYVSETKIIISVIF